MSSPSMTFEGAVAKATSLGQRAVLPAEDELFIDIDSEAARTVFNRGLAILRESFGAEVVRDTPSKSGGPKAHVVVKFERAVTNEERILLQAVLGSDPVRELLSYVATVKGTTEHPTVFFEAA